MTCKEFSEEFDILLNSYGVPVAFGQANPLLFDEYEKSLFLTKAQEAIVTQLYNGKLLGHSFEETEELRMYLESLIRTESIEPSEGEGGLSNCSVFFKLPCPSLPYVQPFSVITFCTIENASTLGLSIKGCFVKPHWLSR